MGVALTLPPDSSWARLPQKTEPLVDKMFNAATTYMATVSWCVSGPMIGCRKVPSATLHLWFLPPSPLADGVKMALAGRRWTADVTAATSTTYMAQFIRI